MNTYIFFKYLHLLSVITMISCLSVELALIRNSMLRVDLRRLGRIDSLYGMAAIAAVAAGLTLWFGVGKGAVFYDNPVLHIKVGLVIIVGLLSVVPTIFFIRKGRGEPDEMVDVPGHIRRLVIIQLLIMSIAPFLATMMANGLRF